MEKTNPLEAPIFLVDDAKDDIALLERVIRQCKILNPIVAFDGGEEFMSYLQDSFRGDAEPVLILLDLNMSPVGGLEILAAVRKMELTEKIGVVMLSGIQNIKELKQGYQLGARTFLIKPITQEDVVNLVSSLPRLNVFETGEGYILRAVPDPTSKNDNRGDFVRSPKEHTQARVASDSCTSLKPNCLARFLRRLFCRSWWRASSLARMDSS